MPSVRSLLWRACKEVLPCKHNLFHRKVVEGPMCPICGGVEMGFHALFDCILPRQVLEFFPDIVACGKGLSSVFEWVEVSFSGVDEKVQYGQRYLQGFGGRGICGFL